MEIPTTSVIKNILESAYCVSERIYRKPPRLPDTTTDFLYKEENIDGNVELKVVFGDKVIFCDNYSEVKTEEAMERCRMRFLNDVLRHAVELKHTEIHGKG